MSQLEPPTPAQAPTYQPVTGYAAAPSGSNGLAVTSFVLSLLGISALAVLFGHIGLGQIRRTNGHGTGLAVAGLIIGYLGVVSWVVFWFVILVVVGLGATTINDPAYFEQP